MITVTELPLYLSAYDSVQQVMLQRGTRILDVVRPQDGPCLVRYIPGNGPLELLSISLLHVDRAVDVDIPARAEFAARLDGDTPTNDSYVFVWWEDENA
jgi:hypothetical protein